MNARMDGRLLLLSKCAVLGKSFGGILGGFWGDFGEEVVWRENCYR